MPTIIIILIVGLFALIAFNLKCPKLFKLYTKKVIPYTHYITISGLLIFLVFEYPKYLTERKFAEEQRKLYFFDLLTKDETANKVREESFVKLLNDYEIVDFSGINITNLDEGLNSSFSFYKCFKNDNSIEINNKIILESIKINNGKILKNIYLNRINFNNSNLSYANFNPKSKLRNENGFDREWFIVDDHFNQFEYKFIFKNLTDTKFYHSNLSRVIIKGGSLRNVCFCNAFLQNAELSNTYFSKCDLSGADFTGANFNNVSLFQTIVDDKTIFNNLKNVKKINIASPFVIHKIKSSIFLSDSINSWEYDWRSKNSIHSTFKKKWALWEEIKLKYPNNYIQKYKDRIKDIFTKSNGENYQWEREL